MFGQLRRSLKIKDMLKKQLWMTDEDNFSHLKSRITEVNSLTLKYKNHPYVGDFMRDWKVIFSYGTYALEDQIDLPPTDICSNSEDYKVIQRRPVNIVKLVNLCADTMMMILSMQRQNYFQMWSVFTPFEDGNRRLC